MLSLVTRAPVALWLLLSAVLFACGEYRSKIWADAPTSRNVVLVVACYAASALAWLPALYQKNQLALLGTIWLLLGTLATVAIGVTVFGEALSAMRWAGLACAAAALALLTLGG